MLFNSLHFVVFFVVITSAYFLLPTRYRWQLILVASCYFYMVFMPVYILILGFTIVVDYFVAIWIEKTPDPRKKKMLLVMSIIANVGVLAIFKYFNFLNDNLSFFLNSIGYQNTIPNLGILLPIGLSFHTFQAMSYTIEVYKGRFPAEKKFDIFSLYVLFYPQLVAGPIERPQNVLPQYNTHHKFDYHRVTNGLKIMTWGIFKKVVIADRISPLVDHVYNNPTSFYGVALIAATVLFAFQIYADFSGYSDIAIGAALVMGVTLMKNFKQPYFSTSISEFWSRWHISLSTWFRDYLYIPLGGNRVGWARHFFNLFVTFLISGIWHGANWTFVIWGALHGTFLIIETIIKRKMQFYSLRISNVYLTFIQHIFVFSLVCFTWVFFRAANVSEAVYIISHMTVDFSNSIGLLISGKLGSDKYGLALIAFALILLFIVEFYQKRTSILEWLSGKSKIFRWSVYILAILTIIATGQFETSQQFIYFQF